MSLAAYEMVVVPRIWDDPRRRAKEPAGHKEIDGLAERFRAGLDAWAASSGELARWLRHAPGRTRASSRRGGGKGSLDDGGNAGPETMH